MRLVVGALALVLAVAGCGGGGGASNEVYFIDGYRSELGMRGRLTALQRPGIAPGVGRLVAEVLRGPTSLERDERGLLTAFPPGVRVSTVAVTDGTARVGLVSAMPPERWPDGTYATAQLVYTVTRLDGVRRVVMTVNGERCCLYDMHHRPWLNRPLTRRDFENWQGAPDL